jgi:hypothetical protein
MQSWVEKDSLATFNVEEGCLLTTCNTGMPLYPPAGWYDNAEAGNKSEAIRLNMPNKRDRSSPRF